MIDILKDIVKHTHGLGFLDLVKITGDDKETAIEDGLAGQDKSYQSAKRKALSKITLES